MDSDTSVEQGKTPPPLPMKAPPVITPPRMPSAIPSPAAAHRKKSPVARALLWVGIMLAVAFVGFIGLRVVQFIQWAGKPHPPTRQSYLYAATANLGPMGPTASGSSETAISLAGDMSERMTLLRSVGYTESERKGMLDEKDKFKTYCDLRDAQCVFLVHVPEMRRFTREAQESLGKDAWTTAREILKERELAKPGMKLAIAMRGLIMYERVLIGEYSPLESTPELGITEIKTDVGCERSLIDWLAPPLNDSRAPEAEAESPQ